MEVYWGDHLICQKMKKAETLWERILGLMFSKEMKGFDGLLITPCRSIHTFFMRYEIDVLFLNSDFKVVKKVERMSPWRMSWIYWRATQVLELKGGTLPRELARGDKIEVKCTN